MSFYVLLSKVIGGHFTKSNSCIYFFLNYLVHQLIYTSEYLVGDTIY